MAPLSSITLVLIFALLLFALSVPTQSEKIQLSRRNLALAEQESEDQPIAKPKTKKKSAALIEQEEEEVQAKSKKKSAALIEQEEEVQALTKPKTKKKSAALAEQDEEVQALTKPKSKKKSAALIEQEEDVKELSQPKTKKKSAALNEQEKEAQSIIKSTTKKKDPTLDSKNQTKPIKPKKSNSTSTSSSTPKSKLNKTLTLKPTNSTKNSTKTLKSPPKSSASTKSSTSSPKTQLKSQNPTPKSPEKTKPVNPDPIWLDESDSDQDLISEFRDLPARIHQTLLPDLKKISITSKAYIYKANKNIAQNVKPFVGNKYAPKIATAASCLFLILPLCLVTALFCTLNSYLSPQRFLIFVQAYLGIYFFTLAITALVTGFEPLRFFYATSPSSYAWTQAVQTLGYLLYLLVQLIHLVVVFSAGDNNAAVRALGLAQMIVGLAVGCHYYAAVFHRAVTGDPPRANWKVHGVYAGCFFVICLCARAERRKKAYDGGEDGKIS